MFLCVSTSRSSAVFYSQNTPARDSVDSECRPVASRCRPDGRRTDLEVLEFADCWLTSFRKFPLPSVALRWSFGKHPIVLRVTDCRSDGATIEARTGTYRRWESNRSRNIVMRVVVVTIFRKRFTPSPAQSCARRPVEIISHLPLPRNYAICRNLSKSWPPEHAITM